MLALFLIFGGVVALMLAQPTWLIDMIQTSTDSEVFFRMRSDPHQRSVMLTIDDSPSSSTAEILDLLKQYQATATFFCIGSQMIKDPKIKDSKIKDSRIQDSRIEDSNGTDLVLDRIVQEGHTLGNHTMYDRASWKLPIETLKAEIIEVDELIESVYKRNGLKRVHRWFRPGSGFFNRKMIEVCKELKYRIVLGSIYPFDPQIKSTLYVYWFLRLKSWWHRYEPGHIAIVHDRRYSKDGLAHWLRWCKENQIAVRALR